MRFFKAELDMKITLCLKTFAKRKINRTETEKIGWRINNKQQIYDRNKSSLTLIFMRREILEDFFKSVYQSS